jgi:hypothetical protein
MGDVNRGDLIRRFGVSPSQASKDIARYLERRPPGLAYDKSAKRYVAGEDFRPVIAEPDATRFLGELRLADLGIVSGEETLIGARIPFDGGTFGRMGPMIAAVASFEHHQASLCAWGRGRDMAPPCHLRRGAGAGPGSVRRIRWIRKPRQLHPSNELRLHEPDEVHEAPFDCFRKNQLVHPASRNDAVLEVRHSYPSLELQLCAFVEILFLDCRRLQVACCRDGER